MRKGIGAFLRLRRELTVPLCATLHVAIKAWSDIAHGRCSFFCTVGGWAPRRFEMCAEQLILLNELLWLILKLLNATSITASFTI